MLIINDVNKYAKKLFNGKFKIIIEPTENPLIKKVAKYKPRVLITILMRPRVKKVIGRSSTLIIGLRINSKIANIKDTLTMVSILGEKERFLNISFSITRANPKNSVYLRIFFMCSTGNYYTACSQNNKADNNTYT